MNDNNDLYLYPVEQLDEIIEKMNNGITPMMNDQLKREVDLRYKELSNIIDIDDDDIDEIKQQQEVVKQAIAKKKREATKKDVVIITLTDEQKAQLRDDMSSSIVRVDPNDTYNLSDDKLYNSAEQRVIEMKLSKLKNCYYNQTDYVNAIHIIQDAIKFSLKNDYPWMKESEAIEAFNRGEIKFKMNNLPKLYINYATQITDKEILKGIITGQVTLKDKNDRDDNELRRRKKNKISSTPVEIPYTITGHKEYTEMAKLHSMGYDTPMSLAFRSKSKIYNRFSLPFGNRFNVNDETEETFVDFDWTREGAGEDYYNIKHNIRPSTSDIIRFVNTENDNSLSNVILQNASEFLRSMKYVDNNNNNDGVYNDNGYVRNNNNVITENPQAVIIEKNILNAIKANNPNL